MVLASVDEGWSFGGAILTFLLPMLAFVFVAAALLILYTKTEVIPGRRLRGEVSVGATRQPGLPASAGKAVAGNGDGAGDGQAAGAGKSGKPVSAE